MSDLNENVATFENQPITDLVNQRMQRIQELEQMRQERIASHGITPNTEGRHTRRDRIIQQATSRSDRRNYYPGIQRTGPVRSRSFDVDSQPRNDSLFRDSFDSQRSNLFGSRQNGSTENVYRSSPLTVRRDSDTNLAQRAIGLVGSDSGSDSSIPGSVNIQGDVSFSVGFNVPSNLMGSDSSLNREPRSASVTRERDSSVSRRRMRTSNLVTADSGRMSRLYSSRESRTRDSRSRDSRRRRTIQGTDRNIVEALEREKIAVEPSARLSPNVLASSDTDLNKRESPETISNEKENIVDKSANYYRPISSYKRKIVVNPDECIPVVAYETEKFIFVHSDGRTYFLDKMHALSRYLRTSYTLPDLTITPPHESEEELGIIESIDGDPTFRYDRLRDICQIKVHSPENEEDPLPTGNEERYQSKSYFTPPRERPSIDNYFASRTVTPLYEGIDMTVFETEEATASSNGNAVNGTVNNQPTIVNGTTDNQFSVSGTSNGDTGTSRTQSDHPQVNMITSQNNSNEAEMETESNSVNNVVDNGNISPPNVVNSYATDNGNSEMNIDEEYPSNVDLDSDTNYESQDMSVSQYNGANSDLFNGNNQRMVIRETIVEHSVEMEDDAYKDITYTHEPPADDPLMTHLQMIHDSSGVPLDTSHLDYDELQMIQKALAENPSPSPPSSPIHSPSTQPITPTQSIREINYTLPEREEMEGEATRPDRLSTILESPGRLQLPSLDFSPLDKNKSDNDTFTFSPTATETTEPNDVFDNVEQVEEKPQDTYDTHEVDQTHLEQVEALEEQHNDEITHSEQVEEKQQDVYDTHETDLTHSEQLEALEEQHNDITDDEDHFTYEEYIQEVPYSFINSPQSPAKTPDSQSRSPSSSFAITRTISSNLEPLSIEIPENSTSGASNDNISKSRSGSRSNSTSVSPLVKSSRGSAGSQGQPSPFEGETVTTVFEEFVSTIPQNMLDRWSPK